MISTLNLNRSELLSVLPKNSVVAEIGVYRGEFSKEILEKANPKQLILIDPWSSMLNSRVVDINFESFYKEVTETFKSDEKIKIIRKTSMGALEDIKDNSLDWVYIDGDHNYKPCLEDLRGYASKIKEDGYICGHDWVTRPKPGFGVNQAVTEFIQETGFTLIGLTNENNFKSYVIAKTEDAVNHFNK
jgi:predicted O-methyltransferase YrrM